MSYLVLARKSRPQTFSEVVGQRSVVKTLQNSLRRKRVAHAILFSGVRGVGKTTLARIMAKAINCEGDLENRPCNQCDRCKEITTGSALDLIEIDGASNRGIQEIRELKEKIKFMPTSCKYKIIIIDEVHMLTTEAFNALLKTLEEPPEHVHFMFATTELHKIPITILSRCQQYELKRIPATELAAHFNKLAEEEGITIEQSALSLIVREAEGSVRDGLSLLDQVFSFGEKHITNQDVVEVLGLVDRDVLLNISTALLNGDRSSALQSLAETFTYGMDIKRFSTDLLDCFRTLLLTKIDGCSNLIDMPQEELNRYIEIGSKFSAETLHQKLNLLMQMVEDMRYSSQPRLAMETGFLKIMEAGNVAPVATMLGKLDSLLQSIGSGSTETRTQSTTPAAPVSQPSSNQVVKKKASTEPAAPPVTRQEVPPPESPIPEESVRTVSQPTPAQQPSHAKRVSPQSKATETVNEPPEKPQNTISKPVCINPHEKDIRKYWPDFIGYVKDRIVWMSGALNRAKVRESEGVLKLHYDDPAECSLLMQKENKNQLTEFVLDFFQKELTVQFIVPEVEEETEENGGESPNKKRQLLANDPLTIMTAEIFHGQVADIRIGPRSR